MTASADDRCPFGRVHLALATLPSWLCRWQYAPEKNPYAPLSSLLSVIAAAGNGGANTHDAARIT